MTPPLASPSPLSIAGTGAVGSVVSATAGGDTISSDAVTVLRDQLTIDGRVSAQGAGAVIEIQRRNRRTKWHWTATARARLGADGSFAAVWNVNRAGRFNMRAVVTGGSGSHAAAASPTITVTVIKPAIATTFGDGFWGSVTACGETLEHKTLGVAHRTLPCGTPVTFYYQGRSITVPVIDRGPYANGADWDLTDATAKALGIDGTVELGAVSARG